MTMLEQKFMTVVPALLKEIAEEKQKTNSLLEEIKLELMSMYSAM